VADLKDDPFRSLAGELRRAGGFAKDTTPFSEFLWADFLRRRLSRKMVEDNFAKAIEKGLALSRGHDAIYLPAGAGRRRTASVSSLNALPIRLLIKPLGQAPRAGGPSGKLVVRPHRGDVDHAVRHAKRRDAAMSQTSSLEKPCAASVAKSLSETSSAGGSPLAKPSRAAAP
jgi:hypothetical protein